MDDFIAVVQDIEGNVMVEIKDDNASLRAYNALLDNIEELELNYIETKQSELK